MRAELKGLSADMAEVVGAYLMMAGQLIDSDPQAAYLHAEAARRRAARLPIVREAAAETAYAAGLYEEALSQYRTLRRMTGSSDSVPVMVDCLRALGKYREALELAGQGMPEITDPAMRLELLIVTAGVRADMGQREEGMRLLRREIEYPTGRHPRVAKSRLLYAFSDLLAQAGDMENARRGFAQAASLDPEGATAALDRLDELDGFVFDLDESEFIDEECEDDDVDDSDRDLEVDGGDFEDVDGDFAEDGDELDDLVEDDDDIDDQGGDLDEDGDDVEDGDELDDLVDDYDDVEDQGGELDADGDDSEDVDEDFAQGGADGVEPSVRAEEDVVIDMPDEDVAVGESAIVPDEPVAESESAIVPDETDDSDVVQDGGMTRVEANE